MYKPTFLNLHEFESKFHCINRFFSFIKSAFFFAFALFAKANKKTITGTFKGVHVLNVKVIFKATGWFAKV